MKLMFSEKRLARILLPALVVIVSFCSGAFAQAKKTAATPVKPAAKKPAVAQKDAKKTPAAATKNAAAAKRPAANAKNDPKRAPARTVAAAKLTPKQLAEQKRKEAANAKLTPRQQAAQKKKEAAANARMTPAQRRAEAERKKREEARRQAALAEQRRREQAAREARARKLAFERGLKTETAENIARDITDGEDLRIRSVAVSALGERAGTVVVMEAQTGKIVTMVNQEWAIRHGFKPCSTIKLVTGVAGANEKLINSEGTIEGNSMAMNLDNALAHSNNAYFQRVGSNLGSDRMIGYARELGLGQPTGINAEGENPGRLPYGNNNPRIYSHADDFEVTPLQLAVMVTAISNGGKRVVPQLQRSRTERTSFNGGSRNNVNLPYESVQSVIPGMIGAAEYGTARRGMDTSLGVAGKTGSCIGRGSWVGLFASVAPVEDPKYAVVVITRGESERGRIAAGIAGEIYRALGQGIKRDAEKNLALRGIRKRPAPIELASNAIDEEEEDDAEAADEILEQPRRVIVADGESRPVGTQQPSERKVVTRTSQSKPVFPTVVIPYTKPEEKPETTEKSRPRVIKND
jgi:penicillin-binding protein 2